MGVVRKSNSRGESVEEKVVRKWTHSFMSPSHLTM
uniref:Uncharacterized protein n=1 Tax=Arundo donax TaxID=35708 RepID=A0A0A9F6J4_ARUDO